MGIAVMGGMVWIQSGEVNGNGTGVFSAGGAVSLTDRSTVRGNRFAGVALENGSSLLIGETTIADNQGDGIWLGDVSMAIGAADLTGNQGWGLRCEPAPAVAQYRGTFNASNNAAGDISCPQPRSEPGRPAARKHGEGLPCPCLEDYPHGGAVG